MMSTGAGGFSVASLVRIQCLQAVMIEVAIRYGTEVFSFQRSNDIAIPYLSQIANRHRLAPLALRNAFVALQKLEIISEKLSHRNGYVLIKPKAFMYELVRQAKMYLGPGHYFMLPPFLRSMSKDEQLKKLLAMVPEEDKVVVIMHSAFLLEASANSPYKGSRILKADIPLSIALQKDSINYLVQAANLVEVKLPRERGQLFPRGFATSDLVIFEKRKLTKALPSEKDSRAADALFNSILLKMHPVRGEEQSEALLREILSHKSFFEEP